MNGKLAAPPMKNSSGQSAKKVLHAVKKTVSLNSGDRQFGLCLD